MREETHEEYRKTLFDRHGADAMHLLIAGGFALMVFFIGLGAFSYFFSMCGCVVSRFQMLSAFGLSLMLAVMAGGAGIITGRLAEKGWRHFAVDGSTTPYEEQYSHEQSLVMRGRIDDALESFEAIVQGNPDAVRPRVRAAELYSREKGNHLRAAQLLGEVQRIPTTRVGDFVYATHRLVDLYAGPLNEPGRAMVELRKLIERLPGTPAADQARDALATLKERHSVRAASS
ncbi:MAG TPA: hypothetical protein VI259_10290 [Gemmatimonadaceae bacterium]